MGRTAEETREHELKVLRDQQKEIANTFSHVSFDINAIINGIPVCQDFIKDIEVAYDNFNKLKELSPFTQLIQRVRNGQIGSLAIVLIESSN